MLPYAFLTTLHREEQREREGGRKSDKPSAAAYPANANAHERAPWSSLIGLWVRTTCSPWRLIHAESAGCSWVGGWVVFSFSCSYTQTLNRLANAHAEWCTSMQSCIREPIKELCILSACTALWTHHVIHTYRVILFALIIFHLFDSVSCIADVFLNVNAQKPLNMASERMSLQHVHRFVLVPCHVTIVMEHWHYRADALKVGHWLESRLVFGYRRTFSCEWTCEVSSERLLLHCCSLISSCFSSGRDWESANKWIHVSGRGWKRSCMISQNTHTHRSCVSWFVLIQL